MATSWNVPPIQLAYNAPYIVSLHPDVLEVHNSHQSATCQVINLQGVERLSAGHSLANFDGDTEEGVLCATTNKNSLYLLQFIDFPQQVQELYAQREYESALHLCEQIMQRDPDSLAQGSLPVQDIHLQHGFSLFARGEFTQAMHHFLVAKADPRVIISLFPDMLPDQVAKSWFREEKVQERIPPNTSSGLSEGTTKQKAMNALVPFLKNHRSKEIPLEPLPDGEEIKFDPVGACVDTALLKAYAKGASSDDMAKGFVQVPNLCVSEDCQKALRSGLKWRELVMFLYHKRQHRKALLLLHKLSGDSDKDPGWVDGGVKEPLRWTIEYLQRLNNDPNPPADHSYAALLTDKIFSPAVLQKLHYVTALQMFLPLAPKDLPSPADTYLETPMSAAPLRDGQPVTAVSPPQVLAHLREYMKGKADIKVHYLEMVVHRHCCEDPEVHDDLLKMYLDRLAELQEQRGGREELKMVVEAAKRFLKSSQFYRAEQMWKVFREAKLSPECIELQALLLARLGDHEKALNIYAHKMEDDKKSMGYCHEHYNPEDPATKDIFFLLFKVYLHPAGEETAPKVSKALEVLKGNFTRVSPIDALRLLPESTDVKELSDWLSSVLKHNSLQRRNLQVQKNLYKAQYRETHAEWITARSASVQIDNDTKCKVCGKKIQTAVFYRFPNKAVVHIKATCFKEYENRWAKEQQASKEAKANPFG